MFENDSIEFIYACHALEHFKRYETKTVLKGWHRVLVPSGILQLAVLDFEAVVQVCETYKDTELVMGLLYNS